MRLNPSLLIVCVLWPHWFPVCTPPPASWYFEATVQSIGSFAVGWADSAYMGSNSEFGVGNARNTFGLWYNGETKQLSIMASGQAVPSNKDMSCDVELDISDVIG